MTVLRTSVPKLHMACAADLNSHGKFDATPDSHFWRNVFQDVAANTTKTHAATDGSAESCIGHSNDEQANTSQHSPSILRGSSADIAAAVTKQLAATDTQDAAIRIVQRSQIPVAGGSVPGSQPVASAFGSAGGIAVDCEATSPAAADPIRPTPNGANHAAIWNPVHATLATTIDGHWKLYVRGAGISLIQAMDASKVALNQARNTSGRIVEITINGQVAYQSPSTSTRSVAEHSTGKPSARLNWSA